MLPPINADCVRNAQISTNPVVEIGIAQIHRRHRTAPGSLESALESFDIVEGAVMIFGCALVVCGSDMAMYA